MNNKDNSKNLFILKVAIFTILFVILSYSMAKTTNNSGAENITYDKAFEIIESGEVSKVVVTGTTLKLFSKADNGDDTCKFVATRISDTNLADRLLEADVEVEGELGGMSASEIISIGMTLILIFVLLKSVSSLGNIGKGQNLEPATSTVKFSDVAGVDEAKESLTEVVEFLKNPHKYEKVGARVPKGVMLVGPPGTGKTLLAKAVAGEAGVPFYQTSGSGFEEMFVGLGASRVRKLFEQAKKTAPSIIFIDEIDAVGQKRGGNVSSTKTEEQTINQLLTCMDGFDGASGVVVIAATNRVDTIDSALLRPGRFDRQVEVGLPDAKGREEILKVHTAGKNIEESIDFKDIALQMAGCSGADIANIVNEAAISAVRKNRDIIKSEDITEAIEIVTAGKEKINNILTDEEKKIVVYHELGHATVSRVICGADEIKKVTVVPRTSGALGFVMSSPKEEKKLMTKGEMLKEITMVLGGRASEAVFCDDISNGASNDIQKATMLAHRMVAEFGMSDNIGLVNTRMLDSDNGSRLQLNTALNDKVNEEVQSIVNKAFVDAKGIIESNKDIINKLYTVLYEKESLSGKEFNSEFDKATKG